MPPSRRSWPGCRSPRRCPATPWATPTDRRSPSMARRPRGRTPSCWRLGSARWAWAVPGGSCCWRPRWRCPRRTPRWLGSGLADWRALVVQACEHVALGCDVDACKHDLSVVDQRRGASELMPMLTLVQARTQAGKAWPQDTARALSTGLGRQSHGRGRPLKRATATLSQQPMCSLSPGAHR